MTAPLTDQEILKARANDRIGTDLVLETETMRIWHLRIGPGETLAAHRHDRPYFWTVLTNGRGSHVLETVALSTSLTTLETQRISAISLLKMPSSTTSLTSAKPNLSLLLSKLIPNH